jgi:hypothetical protein
MQLLKECVTIEECANRLPDELSRKYVLIDGKRRAEIITAYIENRTKVISKGRLL